jgi:hypothetical protein
MSPGNILRTIFYTFIMLVRAPFMIVGFYIKRRRAIGSFRRTLIASGVPRREADELARSYPFKLGDFISLARSAPRQFKNAG